MRQTSKHSVILGYNYFTRHQIFPLLHYNIPSVMSVSLLVSVNPIMLCGPPPSLLLSDLHQVQQMYHCKLHGDLRVYQDNCERTVPLPAAPSDLFTLRVSHFNSPTPLSITKCHVCLYPHTFISLHVK